MPCYLFKGLFSAEEAKILMFYVDHIYIIQKFCNLLHWALFQLVSMVQEGQLSMFFCQACQSFSLSWLSTFHFSNSPSSLLQQLLELYQLLTSGRAAWEAF